MKLVLVSKDSEVLDEIEIEEDFFSSPLSERITMFEILDMIKSGKIYLEKGAKK